MQNITENSLDLINVFRIYENGKWVYEDNYMHFVAEPAYRKAVISFFDTKIKRCLKNGFRGTADTITDYYLF